MNDDLRPLKSDSDISFNSEDVKVNWGAGWPGWIDMNISYVQIKQLIYLKLILKLKRNNFTYKNIYQNALK
jgi:hypothetical protein